MILHEFHIGDKVRVNARGPSQLRGMVGIITHIGPNKYWIHPLNGDGDGDDVYLYLGELEPVYSHPNSCVVCGDTITTNIVGGHHMCCDCEVACSK